MIIYQHGIIKNYRYVGDVSAISLARPIEDLSMKAPMPVSKPADLG
jgi:hypothetical protein